MEGRVRGVSLRVNVSRMLSGPVGLNFEEEGGLKYYKSIVILQGNNRRNNHIVTLYFILSGAGTLRLERFALGQSLKEGGLCHYCGELVLLSFFDAC